MNNMNDIRNSTRIIMSFLLDVSTDSSTNHTTAGGITGVLTLSGCSCFLGLPGHSLIGVLGFFETNSFFGLPGLFFLFLAILLCKRLNYFVTYELWIYLVSWLSAALVAGPIHHRTSGFFSYPLRSHLLS